MLLPTLNGKSLSIGVYILSSVIPANAWSYVAHDLIQPSFNSERNVGAKLIQSQVPNTTPGGAISKFQPTLSVQNGCVPFPAIDVLASGRVGGGLNPSGSLNGGCSSSTGQVYARAALVEGIYAIYYSWYFPKDQILAGPVGLGHRHDWEGVVVFTNGASDTASILAICPARHGTSQADFHCDKSDFQLSGNRPKIQYRPDGTHAIFTTSTSGGSHPLVTWEGLPALARQMLTEVDYGSANVPFIDAVFSNSLLNAKRSAGL